MFENVIYPNNEVKLNIIPKQDLLFMIHFI